MEQEKLSTSANEANNANSSDQLIEYKPIDGGPFWAAKRDDKWFLLFGKKYRLSNEFNTEEEVIEDSKDTSWYRLIQIMRIIYKEMQIEDHDELANKMQKLADERTQKRLNFEKAEDTAE